MDIKWHPGYQIFSSIYKVIKTLQSITKYDERIIVVHEIPKNQSIRLKIKYLWQVSARHNSNLVIKDNLAIPLFSVVDT